MRVRTISETGMQAISRALIQKIIWPRNTQASAKVGACFLPAEERCKRMVTGSLLFGILLVLLYVAYYFERCLQSIAASLIEINAQMDAFIKGASSLVELAPENIEKMYLLHGKLYWWAALGRRVYSNHGDWFHEHEDKST
jgi:hypothetical protein